MRVASGRRDNFLIAHKVGGLVKLSLDDATSAIILLTRAGTCSGEQDGGGRSEKVMFIKP